MEAQWVTALISGGFGVLLFILGYLAKSVSGELGAKVRQQNSQAYKNEAEADAEYVKLARDAMADLVQLRGEYENDKIEKERELNELRKRIERLESDNEQKDEKIRLLESENADLRRRMQRRKGGVVK